ncbi:MAG: G8 domain-containing protein [Planctomycetota bacterium]
MLSGTTTAIASGDWHDAAVWDNGVPDAETRAIIGQGVTVDLDDLDHVAKEIVVHGTLNVPETVKTLGPADPTTVNEGALQVYYDGALAGTGSGSQLWWHSGEIGIGGVSGSTKTHTGNQSQSNDVTFDGRIDSVLNYNRALTATEAADHYANGTSAASSASRDGQVALWNFRQGSLADTSKADAIDDVGTFVGGVSDPGTYDLRLDGVDDRVTVASSSELNSGTFPEKSISLWFFADDTDGRQVIYEQGGTTRGLSIYLDGDTLYAGGWNTPANQSGWAGDWVAVENVTANTWHHVTLVIDGNLPRETTAPLAGGTKTLTADWIHVNSGGLFRVGSEADRFDDGEFVVTLTGTDKDETQTVEMASGMTMTIANNDGFLMTGGGGRLQFFGEDRLTFTKLSTTAEAGDTQIVVENVIERNFTEGAMSGGDFVTSAADDGELNWEVGDEIVVASTATDYREEDVRTIVAIEDIGGGKSRLTLDSALTYRHYAAIETYSNGVRSWDVDMRAEVGLLSRNVKIQGTPEQDTDVFFGDRGNLTPDDFDSLNAEDLHFWDDLRNDRKNALRGTQVQDVTKGVGGHIMIMGNSGQIGIDGVQLDLMGQAGTLGRYPIHWHVGGDRSGDFLRNTSITNSNNRGVTIHGTQNLDIEGVLLHDVHGHGFFFEDGVEYGNDLTSNIAFGIHRVGRRLSSNNFNEDLNYFDPFAVDVHDDVFVKGSRGVLSAAFWVTNPDNDFVGNVVAGSQGMGFWYVAVQEPLGASAATGLYDTYEPSRAPMGRNEYSTVHSTGTGFGLGEPGFNPPVFTEFDASTFDGLADNLTAYKNHIGVWVETEIEFAEYKAVDNQIAFRSFDELLMRDSLIVGDGQGNSAGNRDSFLRHPRNPTVIGFGLYREGIDVKDTHFAGFGASDAYLFSYQNEDNNNRFGSTFEGITFENDDRASQLAAVPNLIPSGGIDQQVDNSDYLYDIDGSLSGVVGGTVVFNNPRLYSVDDGGNLGRNVYVMPAGYQYGRIILERPRGVQKSKAASVGAASSEGESVRPFSSSNNFEKVFLLNDGDIAIDFTYEDITNTWDRGVTIDLKVDTDTGTPSNASMIAVLTGLPTGFTPAGVAEVFTEQDLRSATGAAYYVDGTGKIYIKVFANGPKFVFS